MSDCSKPMTIGQLQKLIAGLVMVPQTRDIWVVAETMDVAVRGGHCYMELVDKAPDGTTVSKARAIIWASVYSYLSHKFMQSTGQPFASGLKVMLRVSVNYHQAYGMSLVVSDIDPSYTAGDLLRRRREILAQLDREGVLKQNRELPWPVPIQRIAVISAPGAAGYGDFINQLFNNPRRLRFSVRLFPAVMQGERAPSTILEALEAVAAESENWDCVAILRGGGSTSDLSSFENLELARAVACFDLPVIVGIGHERDVTVLDYVAAMRVKTPTAAAEWLVAQGCAALDRLRELTLEISSAARDKCEGAVRQLAYADSNLRLLPGTAVERERHHLSVITAGLSGLGATVAAERSRLDARAEALSLAARNIVDIRRRALDGFAGLLGALSPEAVLQRGFSITRVGGRAVTDASMLVPGDVITTVFASGTAKSTVNE